MSGPPGRLVLLNGLPGVGKSTLARRWAESRPGTLVCDVDLLRTWVGGWSSSFVETGHAVRPAALALISAYLPHGDVVLPQLLANPDEVARFERAATSVGAGFVHVLLDDRSGDPAARFGRRTGSDPWHAHVLALVEEAGGEALIASYAERLASVSPDVVVPSVEGDEDATYAALAAALGSLPLVE